mgnify:CR=1 FL=1
MWLWNCKTTVLSLSTKSKDQSCFGVISESEDPEYRGDRVASVLFRTEKEEGGASEIGKSGDPAKQAGGMPGAGGPGGAGPGSGGAGPGGKYVPPSRRGAEGRIGESMPDRKGRGMYISWTQILNFVMTRHSRGT